MAPRSDLFDICGIADVRFWPLWRQELSRTAGGVTQAKDLGPPLWRASFTTANAEFYGAAEIEAALISLNGSAGSFLAHDMRRPYPRAHADGAFSDVAVIETLYAGDAFKLQLSGMPEGFQLMPGDYLGFEYGARPSRALHMVTEGDTFGSLGKAIVRVMPYIRPGALVGAAVTLKRASCEMILDPSAPVEPGIIGMKASSLSFTGVQILS